MIDFANEETTDIAKYTVPVTLSPVKMTANEHAIPALAWDSISYGTEELEKVRADKRGIYAFAVCRANDVLPPHGYVLYIGIARRDSQRPMRERYKDYLNARKVKKRARIDRMIGTWLQVLRFYFAPIDDDISSDDLKALEKQLNMALMPPFSDGDLEADTKKKKEGVPVMKEKHEEIVLPALRGVMGDWVFHSCLMDVGELSSRVNYAEEIHKNEALSDMIQRHIKRGRAAQIAEYLKRQPERLLNSLVIATYGGQPNWHALSDVRSKSNLSEL